MIGFSREVDYFFRWLRILYLKKFAALLSPVSLKDDWQAVDYDVEEASYQEPKHKANCDETC